MPPPLFWLRCVESSTLIDTSEKRSPIALGMPSKNKQVNKNIKHGFFLSVNTGPKLGEKIDVLQIFETPLRISASLMPYLDHLSIVFQNFPLRQAM